MLICNYWYAHTVVYAKQLVFILRLKSCILSASLLTKSESYPVGGANATGSPVVTDLMFPRPTSATISFSDYKTDTENKKNYVKIKSIM